MATTKKTPASSANSTIQTPGVKNTSKPVSTRSKKPVKRVSESQSAPVDAPKVVKEEATSINATPDKSRIIKKYPNRRLYDTLHSTYVTLFDIKGLVMSNISFHVVDAKTGDDLTRSILMQIILEEEAGGQPICSNQSL